MRILVTINPHRCAASQNCTAVAPALFGLGAAGYSRLKVKPTAADVELLREAERGCPNEAITVEIADDTDDEEA